MKRVIIISLILSVFCLSFSIIVSLAKPLSLPETQENKTTPSPSVPESPSPSVDISPEVEYVYADDSVSVSVYDGESINILTMTAYLTGVVAAEMPAYFDIEALRAQAVAARTMTLYHMLCYNSEAHPDADVCTDPTCCQAYLSDEELRVKWGGDYEHYIAKISEAVRTTDGECLIYDGQPIQAVFHSSSSALTAESSEVWAYSLPYLLSVESPETSDSVPDYISTVTVSLADFKETVLLYYPDAVFATDTGIWVNDITYTKSGRIGTLRLGGVSVTGPVLRDMFGLRSTAASIDVGEENIIFTTTGYGHGVGMSQYGANALAKSSYSYKDILNWYYTGISFTNMEDFIYDG